MDRALSVFLLTASLVMVAAFGFGSAQPSTEVSGVLAGDTVWSKMGSPYVFTGTVGVPEGVTLTVEAGVVVDFGAYSLMVNGTLNVEGTESENVFLTADGGPAHERAMTASSGRNSIVAAYGNPAVNLQNACLNNMSLFSQVAAVSIDACTLLDSSVNVYGSASITDSYVTGAVLCRGNSVFSGSTFLGGVTVSGTFAVACNSISNAGGAAVTANGTGSIRGNMIWDSRVGITQDDKTSLSAAIERNLITNNTIGVRLRSSSNDAVIKDNTFALNTVAISDPAYNVAVEGNSFVDNVEYAVKAGADAVNAAGNYWGTTNSTEIGAKIFDSNDDFNLGTIIYVPYLTSANPNAPGSPEDLMMPAASASPTDGVTFQAVNHPAVISSLEVGLAAAVAIVALSVAAAVLRVRRKRA